MFMYFLVCDALFVYLIITIVWAEWVDSIYVGDRDSDDKLWSF